MWKNDLDFMYNVMGECMCVQCEWMASNWTIKHVFIPIVSIWLALEFWVATIIQINLYTIGLGAEIA